MFSDRAFSLLAELEANNNLSWFDAHRAQIKAEVQAPFQTMLEMVTVELTHSRLPLRGGHDTMLRMNRDLRFTKDKTPYNAHISGMLNLNGSKSNDSRQVYVQLGKDGGFVAGGYHKLGPKALGPIRDAIVAHPDAFKRLLESVTKSGYNLNQEDHLVSMPRGYNAHMTDWFSPYLRLRSLTAEKTLSKSKWKTGAVVQNVADFVRDCAGLISFSTS